MINHTLDRSRIYLTNYVLVLNQARLVTQDRDRRRRRWNRRLGTLLEEVVVGKRCYKATKEDDSRMEKPVRDSGSETKWVCDKATQVGECCVRSQLYLVRRWTS